MKHRNPAHWLAVLIFGLSVLLVACYPTVSIAKLTADPGRYQNKTVHIQGTVESSAGALGEGIYRLNDGTGSIWVLSRTGVPGQGARVDSIGRVFQGLSFFGRTFGLAFREEKHKVH